MWSATIAYGARTLVCSALAAVIQCSLFVLICIALPWLLLCCALLKPVLVCSAFAAIMQYPGLVCAPCGLVCSSCMLSPVFCTVLGAGVKRIAVWLCDSGGGLWSGMALGSVKHPVKNTACHAQH